MKNETANTADNRPPLYHYTIGDRTESILKCGHIRTATAFIGKDERPATWLSSNEVWEESANKMVMKPDGSLWDCDKEATRKTGGGLFRFRVNQESLDIHDWESWKRVSNVFGPIAQGLEVVAEESGSSTSEYFCVFGHIGHEHWEAIEYWDGSVWQELEIEDIEIIFPMIDWGSHTSCHSSSLSYGIRERWGKSPGKGDRPM